MVIALGQTAPRLKEPLQARRRFGDGAEASRSTWEDADVLTKINVPQCDAQLMWERGRFHAATCDLTAALGAGVIGASVWETKAGSTQGRYHFHAESRSGCTSSLAIPFCAIHPASERPSPEPWWPSGPF